MHPVQHLGKTKIVLIRATFIDNGNTKIGWATKKLKIKKAILGPRIKG
jgi:hypothetical protein